MMRVVLAALALSCALAAPAAAQQSGTYAVVGTGPDGSRYEGVAQLQATGRESWRITWRIGGDTTMGTGLSVDGMLVVGYVSGREPGVAWYEVMRDGSLSGRWTSGREGGVGTETLLPR